MKVVHLSSSDTHGGAARSAYRLHAALRQQGVDSTMLVANKQTHDETVVVAKRPFGPAGLLFRLQRQAQERLEFFPYRARPQEQFDAFNNHRSEYGRFLSQQIPTCDVVTLHWVAKFLDYPTFFKKLPSPAKLVWRLSDMNSLTGGCHFDAGCGRYNSGCGRCPQLGSNNERDLSHRLWQQKQQIFERLAPNQLHFVAQSGWMAREISQSVLLNRFPVTHIPNGIDSTVFAPRDQQLARAALEIPPEARVVLFVSHNLQNWRKGFGLLTEALAGISDNQLFLLSLGRGERPFTNLFPHLHLGHIEHERLLTLIYSAADLFVIPSLQDTLPNTVLEAMACGLPVVGFNTGGIPDMVQTGHAGELVPTGDVATLRQAIVGLLANQERRREMGQNGRLFIQQNFSLEQSAQMYRQLYEEVVRDRVSPRAT